MRLNRTGLGAALRAAALVLGAGLAGGAMAQPPASSPWPSPALAPSTSSSQAADADPRRCLPEPAPLTARDNAAGLRAATDAGFLWKAVKGARVVYLYGTIHIAQRAWMFPGPHVLAALKASDAVALELDPTDPAIVERLQRAIARKPGAPALPDDLTRRLRAQMIAACLDPDGLAMLRPEMRAVTVEVMAGRRLGLEPAYGVDVFLAQLSHELGKPLLSLETPEAQAALLVSDDPRETARSVRELLDELEDGNGARTLARLAQAWHQGNLGELESYADWCGCLDTAARRADFARLIDARNPLMAERIAAWPAPGRTLFVAVGSLHMTGTIGLPALLQAKGFQLSRVAFDGR